MEPAEPRRVEIVLPMRTVVLVAAAIALMAACVAIGDTFLIVFIGIFLAFVFEYPVRLVMAKTRLSRGLAATITVLGTALVAVGLLLLLSVTLFGALLGVLTAVPLAATIQIFVQERTKARRERVAAAKATPQTA